MNGSAFILIEFFFRNEWKYCNGDCKVSFGNNARELILYNDFEKKFK